MYLIAGLGNPGKRYEKTRHNVGFMVLDQFTKNNPEFSKWQVSTKFNAEISEGILNDQKIIIAKPMTFMNNSGESINLIAHYYKISPDKIIIVHDDKDIPLGTVKQQTDRGHAGHNGIKSIFEHVGTQNLSRIRIGVANESKQKKQDTADFVLGKFGLLEKRKLTNSIVEAIEQIKKIVK